MNYGFIEPKIEKDKDFFLGGFRSAPFEVLQESGQWDEFLPPIEIQHNKIFDSYNCTGYGTLNALEFLMQRKFGKSINFSERYTGICAGTYPPGNDPQTVITSIRGSGLIEEISLPFTSFDTDMTLVEYYSPKPMEDYLTKKGKKFLEEYTIQHDWVYQLGEEASPEKLKNSLKSSPLGVSVNAWNKEGELYVKEKGSRDNHWTLLFGYEDGKFWKIYDSYEDNIKHLAWDYDFGFVKRYYISRNAVEKKTSFMAWLKEILSSYNIFRIYQIGKHGT